jgi:hypothetical protein
MGLLKYFYFYFRTVEKAVQKNFSQKVINKKSLKSFSTVP